MLRPRPALGATRRTRLAGSSSPLSLRHRQDLDRYLLDAQSALEGDPSLIVGRTVHHRAIGARDPIRSVADSPAPGSEHLELLVESRLRPRVQLAAELGRPAEALLARMHGDFPRAGDDDVAVLDGEAGPTAGGQVHGPAGGQVDFGIGADEPELFAAAHPDVAVLGLEVEFLLAADQAERAVFRLSFRGRGQHPDRLARSEEHTSE